MTSTKNDQFFDPPTPTIRKNEQQNPQTRYKFQDSSTPLPCGSLLPLWLYSSDLKKGHQSGLAVALCVI